MMRINLKWIVVLIGVSVFSWFMMASVWAQFSNTKLSDIQALGDTVDTFIVSPDNNWVVYIADHNTDDLKELYSVPTDSSALPTRLNDTMIFWGRIDSFQISADSNYVVFLADQDADDVDELYSVPIDGSAAPTKINSMAIQGTPGSMMSPNCGGPLPPIPTPGATPVSPPAGKVGEFLISPDSSRVVYIAAQGIEDVAELFSVPIDGSAVATKLNNPLVTGGNVGSFQISSNSNQVVYIADQETNDVQELYSVPIVGGSVIKLNGLLANQGDVGSFQISTNSSQVVYAADQELNYKTELYSVPISGGTPIKLNEALLSTGAVGNYKLSSDSSQVVYTARRSATAPFELYSVPIGGGAATKLNGALVNREQVVSLFEISANSSQVVYRANQDTVSIFELYSVPIDGSATAVKLNGTLVNEGDVGSFKISTDSNQVVYRADQDTNDVYELYSVPIDGSIAPTKLNGVLVNGGGVGEFVIVTQNGRVVYKADQETNDVFELYSVPMAGGVSIKLDGSLSGNGDIRYFQANDDSNQVVYTADWDAEYVLALYSVPLDGSTIPGRLDSPQAIAGDAMTYQLSNDDNWVVYLADQETDYVDELYSVLVDGSAAPHKLNSALVKNGDVQSDYQISNDNSRVVYRADQDTNDVNEIYSVPLDGSEIPIKLNEPLANWSGVGRGEFQISADSSRVIYQAAQDTANVFDLYAVPLAGGVSAKLNNSLVSGGSIFDFKVSNDSSSAVYRGVQDTAGVFELYSVPLDGSALPTKLNGAMTTGGDIGENGYQISADGSWVVYIADQDVDNVYELYSVPIDGSAVPTKLNDALVSGGAVSSDIKISADSNWVVYRADQDTNNVYELYSVPIDGSAVATKLNGLLVSGGIVELNSQISADSNWVVYQADQDTNGVIELYSRPIDGSGASTKLNGTLTNGANSYWWRYEISADSSRVIYLVDQDVADITELYSVPIDGSAEPVKLNDMLVAEGRVWTFKISEDSSQVVYQADQELHNKIELFGVPIDGSAIPIKLNGPLIDSGCVVLWNGFEISADNNRVVYIAEQDVVSAVELYVSSGLAEPVMLVGSNGSVISNNDTTPSLADNTDFGDVEVGSVPVVHTFTISNTGTADLLFTNTPAVSLTVGTPFSVTVQPASAPLAPGETAVFEITFTPTLSGTFTDTVTIPNNDPSATVYTFVIEGSASDPEYFNFLPVILKPEE
jgi:hypothetical protein